MPAALPAVWVSASFNSCSTCSCIIRAVNSLCEGWWCVIETARQAPRQVVPTVCHLPVKCRMFCRTCTFDP